MKLILYSADDEFVELNLSLIENAYSFEEILSTRKSVFEDRSYEMEVILPDGEEPVSIQIDDETKKFYEFNFLQKNGTVRYSVKRIFEGQIGVVQIRLAVKTRHGAQKLYYSEYASVLIPSNENNKQIEMMLNYIYDNQPDFLYRPQRRYGSSNNIGINGDESFWAQIQLIEDIASIYESLYGYFKANRRYLLKPVKCVEDTDKLQFIEAATMQHMVQHPEYLHKSLYGFKHGGEYFLPDKVLMTKNIISYDTYENRLIISFLKKINTETKRLSERIEEFIGTIPSPTAATGYIVSFSLLFKVALNALNEYREALTEIEKRLKQLLASYQQLFNFQKIDEMQACPKPTPVMRSVPQYNIVYTYMIKWFTQKGYEFKAEDTMLRFINVSSVYEIYVLVKLIRAAIESGFIFVESFKKDYGLRESKYYRNDAYNNTFVFQNNDERLSIFYTPVIYNGLAARNETISLYRNSSVSYAGANDYDFVNRTGSYYVPDYVLKIDRDSQEKYLICDAKYKKLSTVKAYDGPALGYKYLLCISPSKQNASIEGLDIIFGKTEDNKDAKSFYDTQGNIGIRPKYAFLLTPLAENVPVQNQIGNMQKLFESLHNGI